MTDAKLEDFSLDITLKEEISEEDEPDIKKEEAVALYSRSMAFSISNGLVSPFVSFIALNMGATAGILAWIQAVANLLRQFLDPIFGRLSDVSRRRIPFIIVSTITWILPYAFLFWVKSPIYIILIVALVNILMSLGNPAWMALQNELFPARARGKLTGRVTWFGSFGSMIATFFTGIILTFAFEEIDYQQTILIPVAIGFVISVIAILPFRKIEEPLLRVGVKIEKETQSLRVNIKEVFNNKPFMKFTILYSIFGIFWTFSWPLFSIKQVHILGATALEVSILEIIFAGTSLIFILLGAKVADKVGRTKLVFLNRACLFLFPLGYIFATKIWHLYLVHFFVSSLFSFGFAGVNAYILDLVPRKKSGFYIGVLSMVTGIFYFIGTLAGGYSVEILMNWYSEAVALTIALAFVAGVRFLLSFMFLSLKEVPR
ncbi:MAG: MFS transporter [Candidatus Heimdallarchaeota archaeon]|nr:MFS transporter [Candidatus Heimdallarchaeota archaeon]